MPYRIDEFGRFDAADRERLALIGIRTTGELIQVCATAEDRARIRRLTGLDRELLLRWVHLADLMRIEGIGRQYAELLGESGAGTVVMLRLAEPRKLAGKVLTANRELKLAKTTPSEETIVRWVDEARRLAPRVFSSEKRGLGAHRSEWGNDDRRAHGATG